MSKSFQNKCTKGNISSLAFAEFYQS